MKLRRSTPPPQPDAVGYWKLDDLPDSAVARWLTTVDDIAVTTSPTRHAKPSALPAVFRAANRAFVHAAADPSCLQPATKRAIHRLRVALALFFSSRVRLGEDTIDIEGHPTRYLDCVADRHRNSVAFAESGAEPTDDTEHVISTRPAQ
jgi:hypothetical protein